MATLCHAYTSTQDAENAIERLLSAGVPATGIELIVGHAVEDARDAPVGTFDGTTTANAAPVCPYADVAHSEREAAGTFAGDPDTQRRGSYGDTDRDTVTTSRSGARRTRIASHHSLEQRLVNAGLDPAHAAAEVHALHAGRVLVLIQDESALDVIGALDEAHPRPTLRAAA